MMEIHGWKRLVAGGERFAGEGNYPIPAYSEYMPPARLGVRPYNRMSDGFFSEDDPWGWPVTEYEEAFQLIPGMESIAEQVLVSLGHVAEGKPARGISRDKLAGNLYWPEELADSAGRFEHERFVLILPLALSRTKDDKGRVRWTLFGDSEQGPSRPFWKGFYTAAGRELPAERGLRFFEQLIGTAYDERISGAEDLHRAGFRILVARGDQAAGHRPAEPLPSWAMPFLLNAQETLEDLRYLLTFVPFGELPEHIRRAYLQGAIHLLPFPGSLLFWGARSYLRLQEELSLGIQIPLLHCVARHEGPHGLRIPQAGWMHEPVAGQPDPGDLHGPLRNSFVRTHRWARVHRHEDEIAILEREDKLVHVLFSTRPDDVQLYGKPMARNVQIWTHDHRLLLDGPRASPEAIRRAFLAIGAGGLFGYRFQYPAMRVGTHEVYWHRPLVACRSADDGAPVLIRDAPTGYLTAYDEARPDTKAAIEFWPRILERREHLDAVRLFESSETGHPHQTALNVRKLLDAAASPGLRPLPRSYARRLLTHGKHASLEEWLGSLPGRANDIERGCLLAMELGRLLGPPTVPILPRRGKPAGRSLTFGLTANRSFEVRYWNAIRSLACGEFLNKCNADCVNDEPTRKLRRHHRRDLETLGDHLLDYYARIFAGCGMERKALAGELPFTWRTDFDFNWSGGWLNNQEARAHERNLLAVIPGRDRRRAVIMADHYDTAYMEDVYDTARGGTGARISAAGADDNHSATAALMLAAPVFCKLSQERRLGCDVWLIHLTGEEFPSDCLGARHLCSRLVEGALKLHLSDGGVCDLSEIQVQGVFVLDMVAHNNDHARDIFQISPGTGQESLDLSYQAHRANEAWNSLTQVWNLRASRREKSTGRRSPDGITIPAIAKHPVLHGEVRLPYDPRSTLYNTDGQIFSDAGLPVVLFMENYDINRKGYHDSHDTMENIDLDYASALSAIAIESVARVACGA